MLALLLVSLGVLFYVLAGYPLALKLLVSIRGARPVRQQDITPPVSLVISAYNEAGVIAEKLENALAIDYPSDLLEIVVVSDGSSDGTDEIVAGFASRGVTLARQPERRGKTAGLNRTVPGLRGEVVVFSDANAMYEVDAIRKLVRNFADPEVGCVTGEARYLPGGQSSADVGERTYWSYEMQVKRLETALGSMVGGDGAIYAIRRALWRTLPEDAINDFLNPLQIVGAGWRGVYEPDAACYEETGGGTRTEYKRRVRIVSRSWRAVFQAREVLNPFRVGLFSWCIFSHKILRWASGLAGLGAAVASADLYLDALLRWPVPVLGLTLVGAGLMAGTTAGRHAASMLVYFAVINVASLVGIVKGSAGKVSGIWSTPRERAAQMRVGPLFPVGPVFLLSVVLASFAFLSLYLEGRQITTALFWTSTAALFYVYLAYPLLLIALRRLRPRPVATDAVEPTVCLFIAANDEAQVIEAKLQNALQLDYPEDRLSILVASDGSIDDTNAIVKRFAPRVQLLSLSPRRGKISAINAGIPMVKSEIVVLSDANTFLEPHAIRRLVQNFADAEVGAVSGDVALVGERAALARSEDMYYLYERFVQKAESDIGSMIGADGALYAIRRSLFSAPPRDTILDDMAIPMGVIRSGHRVVFEPDACAHEQGSETATEEFARKSRVIAGAVQFLTRHDSFVPLGRPQVLLSLVSHKALRWLSPLFATCVLVTSASLIGVSSIYAAAAVSQGVLVLLGLAGCIPALRRNGIISFAHYFCLVQAAAAVGFIRGLTGRQSVMWRRFSVSHTTHDYATIGEHQ
jgi:cellulose synthase/poly-beta-1,6-N-acetylglucosamine synthase-like glycosyltransferase